MKAMLKTLIFVAIILGALFSVKLFNEIFGSKMRKYFTVD